MEYDLLLKGGRVIDPKNDLDGPADVGVKDGKIAAVGPGLEGAAAKTVDVAGLYVTPGLIDIHLHAINLYLQLSLAILSQAIANRQPQVCLSFIQVSAAKLKFPQQLRFLLLDCGYNGSEIRLRGLGYRLPREFLKLC